MTATSIGSAPGRMTALELAAGVASAAALGLAIAFDLKLVAALTGVAASLALVSARPRLALLGFVWWDTFVTVDPISVGPIPLKIGLLLVALVWWYPLRRTARLPFTIPVLAVAIGVPVVWSIVASFYPHAYAGLTPSPTRMTIEHASHFVYLLAYFPLADYALTRQRDRIHNAWLIPVCALAVVTWVLYVAYGYLGIDIGARLVGEASGVGPLRGIVTGSGTSTRIFFANHILLVPAIAAAMGYALFSRRSLRRLLLLAFLILSVFPTQTRALTLGALIVVGVAALFAVAVGNYLPITVFVAALVAVFAIGGTSGRVRLTNNLSDASAQTRVAQAPPLIAAWRERPLFGSGLGATLPTGYVRSKEQPYQFETTYYALLFQTGLVGLFLILALPFLVVGRMLVEFRRLSSAGRSAAIVAVSGLAGIFAASAVTPYLISGFGMLAVAAMVASGAWALSERPAESFALAGTPDG